MPADQLDFEFVLFASAVIDYDYIMGLIARYSAKGPGKAKMTREELIGPTSADAKFIHERDDIAEYIGTLQAGEGLSETAIREGYFALCSGHVELLTGRRPRSLREVFAANAAAYARFRA